LLHHLLVGLQDQRLLLVQHALQPKSQLLAALPCVVLDMALHQALSLALVALKVVWKTD
jgi:hypothetical protein